MPQQTATTEARPTQAPETAGHTIRWWAPAYDAVSWLVSFGQEPAIRRRTIKVAKLQPGERVLDVGSGTGTLGIAAWRRVRPDGEVTGIDASPEMVAVANRKAKKNRSGAGFQVAPIEALPFEDASFDAVLSSFMLHHLPEDLKAAGFAEVRRVLKPGGRFVAVDLAGDNRGLISRLASLAGHNLPRDYTDQLTGGMHDAGFEHVTETKTKFTYLVFLTATNGPR